MKKLIILSLTLIQIIGFISKTEGQQLTKIQTDQIKMQVDSGFMKMVGYAEQLDFEKLSAGVDDSRSAGFFTNGVYYDSYSTLIENVVQNARGLSKQDISIKTKKITVLSESFVLLSASGVANALLDDGREISANFHWSFVYEKIDDQWKVIYSHQSNPQ